MVHYYRPDRRGRAVVVHVAAPSSFTGAPVAGIKCEVAVPLMASVPSGVVVVRVRVRMAPSGE
jgi:hypothetical protein